MFSIALEEFQHSKELIFEYLILNKDMLQWIPSSQGFYGVKNNFVEEKLISVEVNCDIGSRKATMFLEITHYEPYNEVRQYSRDAVYETGEPVPRGYLFPFHHMAFRTAFRDTPTGCQVLQEIYVKPQGPLGWFVCKFLILPKAMNELKKSNLALKKHLNSVT